MKCFKILLSAALICAFLTACRGNTQKTETEPETTEAVTETAEPTTSPVPSEYVVAAKTNYNAYLNDDVITLLITAEKKGHAITYDVYNFNKTTGKQLDNEGLIKYLGLDTSETYSTLKAALQDDYTSKFKFDDFPDDYYYQLEMTVGDEAITRSKLFLNGDASLYAACTERASVGAGEFEVLIAIN